MTTRIYSKLNPLSRLLKYDIFTISKYDTSTGENFGVRIKRTSVRVGTLSDGMCWVLRAYSCFENKPGGRRIIFVHCTLPRVCVL